MGMNHKLYIHIIYYSNNRELEWTIHKQQNTSDVCMQQSMHLLFTCAIANARSSMGLIRDVLKQQKFGTLILIVIMATKVVKNTVTHTGSWLTYAVAKRHK